MGKVQWDGVPPIGFMKKGTRKTMDIEECPIGTEAVQGGLKSERARVHRDIDQYQRGATLLLRENTERITKDDGKSDVEPSNDNVILEDRGQHVYRKTCITDPKATSTEYIDDFRFDNPAGAFFQNNNSILPLVTQYNRDNILGPRPSTTDGEAPAPSKIKNMIDAYSGSGFLPSLFLKCSNRASASTLRSSPSPLPPRMPNSTTFPRTRLASSRQTRTPCSRPWTQRSSHLWRQQWSSTRQGRAA